MQARQSGDSGPVVKVQIVDQRGAEAPLIETQESIENGVLRHVIWAEARAERQQAFVDGELAAYMGQFGARRAPIRR